MLNKVIVPNKNSLLLKTTVCFVGLALFLLIQNNHIVITQINYKNQEIPKSFDGFTIAHISDLHNKKFLFNQSQLINKTKKSNPDIIVITGDFIDSRRTNLENSMKFVREAVKIAPVYFVSGNHESRKDLYSTVIKELSNAGVTILDNSTITINRDTSSINLSGISDPLIRNTLIDKEIDKSRHVVGNKTNMAFLKKLEAQEKECTENFRILLSHRPEFFSDYVTNKFNLSLTGHAHGGQIRLPFLGGLFSPTEGFFPKYTSGIHYKDNSAMIISRGLGNSLFPFRIFNRPEIVSITLKSEI